VPTKPTELPVLAFVDAAALREWLTRNALTSAGIYVRVFKANSRIPSVTFEDLLDEGLCFGWSESKRLSYDDLSYLQRFGPRKTKGTTSERNRRHVARLIAEKRMTEHGLAALDLTSDLVR
jgi:uncharacterized protein YdeI (YjbR/CyaY-like superfamily)